MKAVKNNKSVILLVQDEQKMWKITLYFHAESNYAAFTDPQKVIFTADNSSLSSWIKHFTQHKRETVSQWLTSIS